MAKVSSSLLKFAIVLILVLSMSAIISAKCIKNGKGCREDQGPPFCCSGFCYRQVGWARGYCKNR
uniref:Antimicrobial peptide 1 n=1 Tax=Mesembryanthemum crystallinum TaxID=3544 RepID=AMP1_MESCR|nr:RecName: Full=Antimicrobial peptide 1; Flags: Precursor [Mesembryanthemum crystallinum]AAC19399.1 antimicrobial peptide 1 precursor [Mesembryanthemum crystallinum]